ncbi:MAG: hypothetical protein HND52_20065, partial [Ignavibacteriae bacterium]|nr:hypothetical protein [Ignavibacteriota bacterium]NOH00266.1 hypothetical protein [Ignavibacteriota bacterium]
ATWNGSSWAEYNYEYFYAKGDTVYPLRAVWGSSPEDVWAVGDKGTTIHWDGVEWTKIIGGTPYNQSDIWGINSHSIFTVVFSLSNNSQLIHYDGNVWNNLMEILPAGNRNFSSIWMDKSNQGYLVGNTTIQITDNSYNTININQYGFSTKVRGNGVNDVFIISQRGRIYHFNGKTWIYYPEVEDNLGRLNELNGIAIFERSIFIVGHSERALIYKGGRQ